MSTGGSAEAATRPDAAGAAPFSIRSTSHCHCPDFTDFPPYTALSAYPATKARAA